MTTYEIHEEEGWAALYVDGQLDRVGDAYLADERLRELVGCKTVQDNAFMRGQTSRDGVASTLDEVAEYTEQRAKRLARAAELEQQAEALRAEARALR